MSFPLLLAGLFNVGIFAGYLFVALFVAPELAIEPRRTRWSGIAFFATCGLTHFDLALHAFTREPLAIGHFESVGHLLVHGVQVVSVWFFVTGIYTEVMKGSVSWPLPIRPRRKP